MIETRKICTAVEEVFHEGGPPVEKPLLIGTIAAVVRNPFAGTYAESGRLMEFMAELKPFGRKLATQLVARLGGTTLIEAYGKGAIVGEDGELEHGALWHEPGGWGMREVLGGTKAIVPAAKTVAAVGTRLMVPLGHVNAAYVRSHFHSAEIAIWDAPKRGEIVYALAMATGPRIHARCGGLKASEISVGDGQR